VAIAPDAHSRGQAQAAIVRGLRCVVVRLAWHAKRDERALELFRLNRRKELGVGLPDRSLPVLFNPDIERDAIEAVPRPGAIENFDEIVRRYLARDTMLEHDDYLARGNHLAPAGIEPRSAFARVHARGASRRLRALPVTSGSRASTRRRATS